MTDLPILVPVDSSNLRRVGYDPEAGTLYVEFKPGKTGAPGMYAYDGVPAEVHAALMLAGSKGRYLNAVIKPAFGYRRLEPISA